MNKQQRMFQIAFEIETARMIGNLEGSALDNLLDRRKDEFMAGLTALDQHCVNTYEEQQMNEAALFKARNELSKVLEGGENSRLKAFQQYLACMFAGGLSDAIAAMEGHHNPFVQKAAADTMGAVLNGQPGGDLSALLAAFQSSTKPNSIVDALDSVVMPLSAGSGRMLGYSGITANLVQEGYPVLNSISGFGLKAVSDPVSVCAMAAFSKELTKLGQFPRLASMELEKSITRACNIQALQQLETLAGSNVIPLPELGVIEHDLQQLIRAIDNEAGILITGPAGWIRAAKQTFKRDPSVILVGIKGETKARAWSLDNLAMWSSLLEIEPSTEADVQFGSTSNQKSTPTATGEQLTSLFQTNTVGIKASRLISFGGDTQVAEIDFADSTT